MGELIDRCGLYWRTAKHLKPIQITNRLRRLFPFSLPSFDSLPISRNLGFPARFLERPRSLLGRGKFELLNIRKELQFPAGWNDSSATRLWLYNLHYHDGLLCSATASELKTWLVRQWISDNAVGSGCGWEPYPTSVRIVNWIKWQLTTGVISSDINVNRSLAVQVRYLLPRLELHLLGNHLLTNAKALIFAGLYFEGMEAARWLEAGQRLFDLELQEQFLPDGAHFELSTTYHAQLTEDVLDVIQMFRLANRQLPAMYLETATRALNWLAVMTRPDGLPPLFNDATYGISRSYAELVDYAQYVGCAIPSTPPSGLTHLRHSGYFRFHSDRISIFGDVGPVGPDYIPGHAHCDMLSFEMCVDGRATIVDTGVSTYEIGQRRSFERGTAAHNTVQVGDLEQSEMWSAFRVGRRARIRQLRTGPDFVEAAHDGFLAAGLLHQRRFEFGDDRLMLVDTIISNGSSAPLSVARFHFVPGADVECMGDCVTAGALRMTFEGARSIELGAYSYAPSFNITKDAPVLSVGFHNTLLTTFTL